MLSMFFYARAKFLGVPVGVQFVSRMERSLTRPRGGTPQGMSLVSFYGLGPLYSRATVAEVDVGREGGST